MRLRDLVQAQNVIKHMIDMKRLQMNSEPNVDLWKGEYMDLLKVLGLMRMEEEFCSDEDPSITRFNVKEVEDLRPLDETFSISQDRNGVFAGSRGDHF